MTFRNSLCGAKRAAQKIIIDGEWEIVLHLESKAQFKFLVCFVTSMEIFVMIVDEAFWNH